MLARPLIGLDFETTGLSRRDRIVQIALEIYNPGEPVKEWKTLVNPGIPIPPEVSDVHGITDAMVRHAPSFFVLAPRLVTGLSNCDFTGKNIKRFDLPLLKREFANAGYADWTYEGAAILDVDRLWQVVDPRHLKDAVNAWGTNRDQQELGDLEAHDALSDVRWSTRVAANMVQHAGMFGWSAAQVHAQLYPDDYDVDGKLRWLQGGELCLTFSDHRDLPLSQVDKGFLKWMLGPKADFSPKVKEAVAAQLNGTPMRREPRLAGAAELP